jgi:hypothetical protein
MCEIRKYIACQFRCNPGNELKKMSGFYKSPSILQSEIYSVRVHVIFSVLLYYFILASPVKHAFLFYPHDMFRVNIFGLISSYFFIVFHDRGSEE